MLEIFYFKINLILLHYFEIPLYKKSWCFNIDNTFNVLNGIKQ